MSNRIDGPAYALVMSAAGKIHAEHIDTGRIVCGQSAGRNAGRYAILPPEDFPAHTCMECRRKIGR